MQERKSTLIKLVSTQSTVTTFIIHPTLYQRETNNLTSKQRAERTVLLFKLVSTYLTIITFIINPTSYQRDP